jgi:hypothetical protein
MGAAGTEGFGPAIAKRMCRMLTRMQAYETKMTKAHTNTFNPTRIITKSSLVESLEQDVFRRGRVSQK